MLDNYRLRITYINSGKLYGTSNEKTGHYVIDGNVDANHCSFIIRPTVKMEKIRFSLTYSYDFDDDTKVYLNGYQSWTDSRELTKKDTMPPLTEWASMTKFFSKCDDYGDYNFTKYIADKGFFHGFSYGYIKNGNNIQLIGSLNERSGYTVIYVDMEKNEIVIEKELEGVTLDNGDSYELMNIFFAEGGYDEVFDNYFSTLNIPKPRRSTTTGYTSWYNYYSHIDANIINRDLESIAKQKYKLNIFQIDDGFQTQTGDWLSIDPIKFPDGLKPVVDNIHSKDMLAGLWLAPFNANRKSEVFKKHKDWFIRNSKDILQCAGVNWGPFYTLDIYNPEVKDYLKKVFDTVLLDYGFDMVKLDFLYSVSIVPYNGKSRGEIMCDAMDLIRELCGDKLVLGCGVPLFPSFGKVDYCRIGCDVSLNWSRPTYFNRYHRESIGTENTLKNTIFRRHLDGRAFVNDPDVFLLRQGNIKLTLDQRALLAKINKLCGNLLFTSDNVAEYTKEQQAIFNDTIAPCKKKIIDANYIDIDIVAIDYIINGKTEKLVFNIKDGIEIKDHPVTIPSSAQDDKQSLANQPVADNKVTKSK